MLRLLCFSDFLCCDVLCFWYIMLCFCEFVCICVHAHFCALREFRARFAATTFLAGE